MSKFRWVRKSRARAVGSEVNSPAGRALVGGAIAMAMAFMPLASFGQQPSASQSTQSNAPASLAATSTSKLKTTERFKRDLKAGWKIALGGESFTDEQNQEQHVGLGFYGDLRMGLLPMLELRTQAAVVLQSGYQQSTFGESTQKNGVMLKEAFLQFKPLDVFALEAGALDQGAMLEAPLLISPRPFPGVAEKLKVGGPLLSAELRAEQCIPTSSSLTTKAVEAEPAPSFFAESLILKTRPLTGLELKASGTHYRFQQLPSSIAAESSLYGNTLQNADPGSERFLFEYEGYVASGAAKVQLMRGLSWGIDGQMIRNTRAEETYQNAQIAGTEFVVGLPGDVDLKPRAEMFFIESDVAPAFYNSSEYGHANRQGWAADLKVTFKPQKFRVGARYVASDLINPSLEQSRQAYFMLRFETLYDVL